MLTVFTRVAKEDIIFFKFPVENLETNKLKPILLSMLTRHGSII